MSKITSAANPRVKDVVRLQRQSSERRRTGRFCVEFGRDLERALAAGYAAETVYHCPSAGPLPADVGEAEVVQVSEAVLAKLAYREHPEGFVAVLEARRTALAELAVGDQPLILVASGVEKPGNLGAMLRSADAAGADAVFVDSPEADVYSPPCVRASTGAVFALPIVCESAETLGWWLGERGVLTLAATPEAELTYLSMNFRGATAIVVGAEAEGLSGYWRGKADVGVSIPMRGRAADSLNVSVSAAVLLFEARRQRIG